MYSLNLTDYKWNWIDDGILPYALVTMRTLWVSLLVHLGSRGLMPDHPDLISPLLVFGLLAASTACTQVGVYLIKVNWRAVLLVAFSGLAAILLTLYLGLGPGRPIIWELGWLRMLLQNPARTSVTLVIAVGLWWWGIRTGRERLYYDAFSSDFAWGMFLLALAGAIAYATHVIPVREVLVAFIPFFAVGLITMAIANLQSTRRFEGSRTNQSLAVNRYWLGMLIVVVGAVVLGGLLLSQLFAPEAVDWVLVRLATLFNGLVWLLFWVLLLIAYPIFRLFELVAGIVRLPRSPSDQPLIQLPPPLAEQFKDLQGGPSHIPPEVYLALQILAGVLLVAAVILIFALAFRRFKTLLEDEVEESREIIFSMDLLKEQLAQLLGRRAKTNAAPPEPFVCVKGDDPRAQIRRTYQALLAWAAAQGTPRSPGQTPAEYLSSLGQVLPSCIEPISTITTAYVQARYSAALISPAVADQVLHAWQVIMQANGEDG
jgi:uncharacterized membrane protein YidH (DUF202 family)